MPVPFAMSSTSWDERSAGVVAVLHDTTSHRERARELRGETLETR